MEPSELLTPAEAARYLRIQPRTLRKWRTEGYGPRHLRYGPAGFSIRYRRVDLEAWLEDCAVDPAAQVCAAEVG